MKLKSSKNKTNHILVDLSATIPDEVEGESMRFGYIYFHLEYYIKRKIKKILYNLESDNSKSPKYSVQILNSIFILNAGIQDVSSYDGPDYEYVFMGSINYLRSEPEFHIIDQYYNTSANIICYRNYFVLEVERTLDDVLSTVITYQSHILKYGNLLN